MCVKIADHCCEIRQAKIYTGPDHVKGTVHPTHEDARNDPNEN